MPNDIGNRDPEVFPEPNRPDRTRAPRNHPVFGSGVHHCLGHAPARMELQVVHSTLHRRIPIPRLATDLEPIPFVHDGSVYGVHALPVTAGASRPLNSRWGGGIAPPSHREVSIPHR